MHSLGFDWICDIAYVNGMEVVASKMNESHDLWWRSLEVEGDGFTRLFKNSIRKLYE